MIATSFKEAIIRSGGLTSLNDTSIYSVKDSVILQSGKVEGNGTQFSA